MQGDPKVDELMRPVLAAIKRHVKNSDATTDIYNRAYEAVMNSMDVKTGKTYCAYCGAEYPLDDKAAAQVSEHIKTCEKHPMRAAEAEVARLTALSTMKDDALDSYAEFYGRAAGMCGLPDDALPGAQTDAIILQRLAEHDEIARLTAALAAANEDAERLASVLEDDGYPVKRLPMNAKRLSLAAHRARMGGA